VKSSVIFPDQNHCAFHVRVIFCISDSAGEEDDGDEDEDENACPKKRRWQ
jgi:hypothetical protein